MRYTRHAQRRMAERNLTPLDVLDAVENHEVAFTDKKGNSCLVRNIDGRRIKVVVAATDAELVITVIDLDA